MNTLHRQAELTLGDERLLLTAATSAPSLHNSQPWSFEIDNGQLTV
jgi:nitroreductase